MSLWGGVIYDRSHSNMSTSALGWGLWLWKEQKTWLPFQHIEWNKDALTPNWNIQRVGGEICLDVRVCVCPSVWTLARANMQHVIWKEGLKWPLISAWRSLLLSHNVTHYGSLTTGVQNRKGSFFILLLLCQERIWLIVWHLWHGWKFKQTKSSQVKGHN